MPKEYTANDIYWWGQDMFEKSLNESTELTVNTLRKIRNLIEFLKAIDVKESVTFYLISQISDFISQDPDLAESFIQDEYKDGDWRFLWEELLQRVSLYNKVLVEGRF